MRWWQWGLAAVLAIGLIGCGVEASPAGEPLPVGERLEAVQGVTAESAPEKDEDAAPLTAEQPGGQITIDGVRIVYRQEIIFTGESTLSEGSCLNTQLYAADNPVAWWPAGQCVAVQDGAWRISVPLGSGGVPDSLDAHTPYRLRAWSPENPAVLPVVFQFDLLGPRQP